MTLSFFLNMIVEPDILFIHDCTVFKLFIVFEISFRSLDFTFFVNISVVVVNSLVFLSLVGLVVSILHDF